MAISAAIATTTSFIHPSYDSPFTALHLPSPYPRPAHLRLTVSSSLNSSNPNNSVSSFSFSTGGGGELHHALPPPPPSGRGVPVFVTLPVDAVGPETGKVARRKAMGASFMALAAAGVEGVAVEFWWGVVERDGPGVYAWDGYVDLVRLARRHGLKVRAVMAFHQCGSSSSNPGWIPLPRWVLEEMDEEPDLAYSDRFGRRSHEYISLGCDVLPVLKGRSPIQVYSDFMRNFRYTFREFLGLVITDIQVGMGPAGELRYPSCPTEKLTWPWRVRELGEFQCYDKFMLASLNACAKLIGMSEWGSGGPLGAGSLMQNPEETSFFKSDGSWHTPYGRFFLEWYSGLLLHHGERLCMAAESIFWSTGVRISGKVAGIHWHYGTNSHPSELTAGYYNTFIRDGYLPIARLFARYKMTLCCTCFDMQDADEEKVNPSSSPEKFLRQLAFAARMCNIPLAGENFVTKLDEASLTQVVKSSKLYSSGVYEPSLSFNYVRMNRDLFDSHNWTRFTRLVKQLSHSRNFQAKLDFGGGEFSCSSTLAAEEVGAAFAYH